VHLKVIHVIKYMVEVAIKVCVANLRISLLRQLQCITAIHTPNEKLEKNNKQMFIKYNLWYLFARSELPAVTARMIAFGFEMKLMHMSRICVIRHSNEQVDEILKAKLGGSRTHLGLNVGRLISD
jgi:hypothetical protein